MQFSGKWMEVENITECGNSVTKEEAQYVVTDNWILSQMFGIPKIQFPDHMKSKKKEDHSVNASVLLRRLNKKKSVNWKKYGDKVWSRD